MTIILLFFINMLVLCISSAFLEKLWKQTPTLLVINIFISDLKTSAYKIKVSVYYYYNYDYDLNHWSEQMNKWIFLALRIINIPFMVDIQSSCWQEYLDKHHEKCRRRNASEHCWTVSHMHLQSEQLYSSRPFGLLERALQ